MSFISPFTHCLDGLKATNKFPLTIRLSSQYSFLNNPFLLIALPEKRSTEEFTCQISSSPPAHDKWKTPTSKYVNARCRISHGLLEDWNELRGRLRAEILRLPCGDGNLLPHFLVRIPKVQRFSSFDSREESRRICSPKPNIVCIRRTDDDKDTVWKSNIYTTMLHTGNSTTQRAIRRWMKLNLFRERNNFPKMRMKELFWGQSFIFSSIPCNLVTDRRAPLSHRSHLVERMDTVQMF